MSNPYISMALNSGSSKGGTNSRNFLGALKPSRMVGTFNSGIRKMGYLGNSSHSVGGGMNIPSSLAYNSSSLLRSV